MKDFTKKGTKLPVIPVGTEYLTGLTERKWESHYCKKPLYSHGETLRRGEVYIKAEKKNYNENDDFYLIKLSTIERLAKEQGMCDGCIDFEFIKDWWHMLPSSKNQELRQIYFKNHIGFLGIDRLFFIYKSEINNENTKVKLQENGTVTVTDTETTTTLSKATVDEICRLVKEDGEKVKLEVGKWNYIKSKSYDFVFRVFITEIKWTKVLGYGFDEKNIFYENTEFISLKEIDYSYLLNPETVQQYLIEEAVKRGYEKGTKYKHIKFDTVEVLKQPENLKLNLDYNNLTDGCGGSIFDEGVWATIIKPETITRAEAEKQTVFTVVDINTGVDFGIFSTKKKAEKFICTSKNFTIVERPID